MKGLRTATANVSVAILRTARRTTRCSWVAQPQLCLECHPDAEGSNKHPVRPKYYDLRAHRGLTCTSSCHNPHGTQFDAMVKDYNPDQDGMCLQCHTTVGVYY